MHDHSPAIISIPTHFFFFFKRLLGPEICFGGRKRNFVGGLTFDVLEFPVHFGDAIVAAQVYPQFNRLHLHTHPRHPSQEGRSILECGGESLTMRERKEGKKE